MPPNEKFMQTAIRKARQGIAAGQSPYGAAIVRNGRVVACRHNVVAAEGDPTAHAEVTCIRAACRRLGRRDLSDCEIYSTCEPCAMCAGACYAAGISTVYFGAHIADKLALGLSDLGIGAAELGRLSPVAPKAIGGVCREECVELFRLYLETTGRVPPAVGRTKRRSRA